jgi:hypothetical protein
MPLRIPQIIRGRAQHASSADSPPRRMTFYRHSKKEKFENPLPVSCRIAVLAPNFSERDGVRAFDEEQYTEIQRFGPEILAGTVPVLLRLAETIRLTRALVAFSGARVGPVTNRDRDLLWSAYQVPIFEQCLGPDGAVIARECEAHDGLHLYLPDHYRGALRTEPCACGRTEPRIA